VSREKLSSDEEYPGKYRTSLMRIDAETLEVSSFSPDDGTYIVQPLGWSPNGSLLAVLRHENGTFFDIPPQLCLFTRDGELLVCTVDRPPLYPGVASGGLYRITWSEDSRYIYFLSDNYTSPTQGTRRIVEVDVATGETQRTVFEVPFEYEAPVVSWTSDLSIVVVGAGNYQQYQGPKRIINLETGVEIDPNTLVPEGMKLYEICPEFSPFDTYMSVVAVKDIVDPLTEPYEYALYVLDTNGTGIFTMDKESDYDAIRGVGCPTWQADDRAIFFSASTEHAKRLPIGTPLPRIFEYNFESRQLEVYFEYHLLASGFNSLLPSADGNYLVLSTQYFTLEDTVENRTWQIIIVFPDDDFREFRSPQDVDWWYPIWVPPAPEEAS
jgi:hypothetical protein